MGNSASGSGDGISMQKDQVTTAQNYVYDLGTALGEANGYKPGDGITAGHFGDCPSASEAGGAVMQTLTLLQTSMASAMNFVNSAGDAIKASLAATTAADEDSQWGITNAGKGA
jgi:hypothetical protein